MLLPGDWGQGKNCTLFMFNNAPGDADDPTNRNPKERVMSVMKLTSELM